MNPASVKRIKYGKSPNDVTPVTADFTGALEAIDNDTLDPNTAPVIVIIRNDGNPADCISLGTPSMNADKTRVSIWLAAGTVGFEYLVSCTVMSADGQEICRSFVIPCVIR